MERTRMSNSSRRLPLIVRIPVSSFRRGAHPAGVRIALLALVVWVSGGSPARAQSALDRTPVVEDSPASPAAVEIPRLSPDQIDPAVLERARLLLSAIHGVPDRGHLEAEIPMAREVLATIVAEPDLLPLQRGRAVWALARWTDDGVLAAFAALLADDATDDVLRHQVMMAVAESFGERSVFLLEPYLANPDVQLRLTAVEALSRVGTDVSRATLDRAAGVEVDPLVRARLVAATARVQ